MKRSGSDYWPLFHDDFWDDSEVLPLSASEAGVYLYLLGVQAKHGNLPPSDASIGAIGRRFREWEKVWPRLQKFFPLGADGLRRNPRLQFELEEIDAKRSKANSRKSRWRERKGQLSTSQERGQTRSGNVPVPPMSRGRGEERREEERRGKENAELRSATRDKRAAHAATSSATRLVSDFWCDRFLKLRGSKYVWQGAKDGALLARLLKATEGDVVEVQRRIERFLTDPFWAEKADWSKFCSQYNAMAGPGKAADPFAEAARMLGVEAPL